MRAQAHIQKVSNLQATYIVGACVVVLALVYAYFVIGTILEIVLREELALAVKDKHSSMAVLEADYLKKEQTITLEFAENQGFSAVEREDFASRQTFSQAVSTTLR